MPLCLQRTRLVAPQPVKGTPCISRSETMFWSNPGLFLNCSTRLKRTSGAKLSSFCRTRSRSSKMARCFAVWPSAPSAAITFDSVFQSSVFISWLRSSSIFVGRMPSKSTRTLSFFFTLFGALELAGEEIIHHPSGDERTYSKILLRIVIEHVELELVAAVDQSREKFVHPELFLIRPLAHRVHQPPAPHAQIAARFNSGGRGEELPQIGVVEIRVRIFIKLPFARVIGLELDVQTIVIGRAILRCVHRRLPRQKARQFIDVFEFLHRFPARVTLAPVELRREPDRERLREIFVRMALRVPVVEMHDVAATKRARPIKVRRLLV